MRLGVGTHQYEWLENWAKLPPDVQPGYTHGVVVDALDNVYVFNQSRHAVIVFDRDGNFLKSWGESFQQGAHGMFLSHQKDREYLYLTDYERHVVAKTTLDGEVIFAIGRPDRPDIYTSAEQFKPTDVCVAPDGGFYVFDGYGLPYVHQYDANAKYVRSFGGDGSAPGQLKCPHGGWVDTRRSDPMLYVADRGNNRIQKFTLDGQPIGFVTDNMQMPCCFYEAAGDLYIPDLQARVTILDLNDQLITHLGDNPQAPKTEGWPNIQEKLQPGKFNSPHAVCVDSHGDLYVVEWISTGRITKLRRKRT